MGRMSAFPAKFWIDGYWLPTIEAAIAKAEQIGSAETSYITEFAGAPSKISFSASGEPEGLTPYATKASGAWEFASTGYAIGGTA